MKSLTKILYSVVSITTLLSTNAAPIKQEPEKKIKILTQKPDKINLKDWGNYCSSIKNYLTSITVDNTLIHDYDIDFSYNEPKTGDKEYEENTKSLIKEMKESKYDMFIVDDNFLYGDVAFIESDFVNSEYDRSIHENFVDLTTKVDQNVLSYHDAKILEGAYLDKKLYALPYEKDFDLLYYHNTDAAVNNLDLEKSTWDDLLALNANTQPCSIDYADSGELLNTFMEYTYSLKDLSGPNYEVLYNDTSKDIYNSFKNFVSKNSVPNTNIPNDYTLEKAFDTFSKKQSVFFKGKASHYHILVESNTNNDVAAKLPPKNYSNIKKRYLVINKNSLLDEKVLIEAALLLTSKEVQLYKAGEYGKIPTFDIGKKGTDASIKTYTDKHANIVGFEEKIKPIHNREIFSGENSAPLLEIRTLLPLDIKNYLKESKDKDLTNALENTKRVLMDKANVIHLPTILLYIPIIIFLLIAITVIFLIFKYRNHPYMKIASPGYCILCIIGVAMNIASPLLKMEATSIASCKFVYIYETVYTDLMIFPLVAITYRIYTIYKNKAKDNKSKNLNKKVSYVFIIGLIIMIIYSSCCALFLSDFHFVSYGTIDTYRQPVCENVKYTFLESIERRVNELIYIIMIILIIKTGRISKKFGEFKYIYFLFAIGIMEYALRFILSKLPSNSYFGFYLVSIIINGLLNIALIYYLIGSRLIYVMRHPNDTEPYKIEELVKDQGGATDLHSQYELEE